MKYTPKGVIARGQLRTMGGVRNLSHDCTAHDMLSGGVGYQRSEEWKDIRNGAALDAKVRPKPTTNRFQPSVKSVRNVHTHLGTCKEAF